MRFNLNSSEWIGELKSYLVDSSKKTSEIKKVLRAVDFSKISYEDKYRLSKLFDPTAEITGEAFKRQLDLYFSLLESKSSPMTIPVFSEYIEWVYSQDPSKIPDKMFDLMISRLARSSATTLPESVSSFTTNLTQEFNRDIDKMSNMRLGTLVSILKDLNLDYKDQPEEVQNFIKRIFIACAIKTEVADKNKREIRGMFGDDPKGYYDSFNKAFAGYESPYATWIDEPAKKLSTKNMLNYANFQERILNLSRRDLYFGMFQRIAREMKLPRLSEYDERKPNPRDYLLEKREYKDYAKKLASIFAQMVRTEAVNVAKKAQAGTLTNEDVFMFAPTNRMIRRIESIQKRGGTPTEFGNSFAQYLISSVHLDELSGQSSYNIFNSSYLRELTESKKPEQVSIFSATPQVSEQVQSQPVASKKTKSVVIEKQESPLETSLRKELAELYETYHEMLERGQRDLSIESRIFDIETELQDFAEENGNQPGDE